MKINVVYLIIFSLFTTTAYAENKSCYKLKNASSVTAADFEKKNSYTIMSGQLELHPEALSAEGYKIFKSAIFKFVTEDKKLIDSHAFNFSETERGLYSIECDGGRVRLQKRRNGSIVARTEYLSGTLISATADEGCGIDVALQMKSSVFTPTECK